MAQKKKPADEKALRAEIETVRAEYENAVKTQPAHIAQRVAAKVKSLTADLAALLATGAQACPACEVEAIGMRVRAGVYEVGCPACPLRARGETVVEAVENWNAGEMTPAKEG